MHSIQALREKRSAKAKEYRAILDAAGDDFNNQAKPERKDDAKNIDALKDEIERIDAHIAAIERAEKLDADGADDLRNVRERTDDPNADERDVQVFDRWVRNGMSNLSDEDIAHIRNRPKGDLSKGDAQRGGYLAPGDFTAQLLERLKAFGGVRQSGATVIQTESGNDIDWPTVDETAEEGEIVNESQIASDGDMDFGLVGIRAHKYSSKVLAVPIELLMDAKIDIVAFIQRALGTRIARIQNRHFTTGTGSNQPRGFVSAAAVGRTTTTGQTTSLIYEDFVELEHSIDPAYRQSGNHCKWQFHDTVLKTIKKLKDSTGRPLWAPGISSAEPDTLLRYGYTINQHMSSSIAASEKTVAFGDFSKYVIRDVMNVTLLRFDDSAYAKKGQVGFLAFARADGNVIDALDENDQSGAFKVLQQAAS